MTCGCSCSVCRKQGARSALPLFGGIDKRVWIMVMRPGMDINVLNPSLFGCPSSLLHSFPLRPYLLIHFPFVPRIILLPVYDYHVFFFVLVTRLPLPLIPKRRRLPSHFPYFRRPSLFIHP